MDLPLTYENAFNNSGQPLQRGGLVTEVIAHPQPIVASRCHDLLLQSQYSLHPDSKLHELRRDRVTGKTYVPRDDKAPVHLIFPEVEAGYNFTSGNYEVSLRLDYNAMPEYYMTHLHSLFGSKANLDGTVKVLNDLGLPITGKKAAMTAEAVDYTRRQMTTDGYNTLYGQNNLKEVAMALFHNNNKESLMTDDFRNRCILQDGLPVFAAPMATCKILSEMFSLESAVNKDHLMMTAAFSGFGMP
jgi:hypothetical protein